jgi:hypothetical protein
MLNIIRLTTINRTMEKSRTNFDDDFREIGAYDEVEGFYPHFPQMMPWVGEEYDGPGHKKILFIGESHYLPDGTDEGLFTKDGWYEQEAGGLDEDPYEWTNTRFIVERFMEWSTKNKAQSIYNQTEKVIREVVNEKEPPYQDCTNMFRFAAYYNYFLRPAQQGDSFKNVIQHYDKKVAYDALNGIVDILKPDFIYFLSTFAYDEFKYFDRVIRKDIEPFNERNPNIILDFSPHPSCSWWNRKKYTLNDSTELLTGKEKLIEFLKMNKVF